MIIIDTIIIECTRILLDIVWFAEDHTGPCEARASDLLELDLAEGAFETRRVPIVVQRVQ